MTNPCTFWPRRQQRLRHRKLEQIRRIRPRRISPRLNARCCLPDHARNGNKSGREAMMMMKRVTCLGCLAFAVWMGSEVSAAAQSNAYDSAVIAWKEHNYQKVIDLLSLVRGQPEGRRLEVDYLLGTSACQTDRSRQWGRNLLNAISYKYPVAASTFRTIQNESDKCQTPIPTNPSA